MLFVFPHLISLNCLNIKIDIPAKFIQSYSFHLHDITLYECRVSVCVCVCCGQKQELEESGTKETPRGIYKLKGSGNLSVNRSEIHRTANQLHALRSREHCPNHESIPRCFHGRCCLHVICSPLHRNTWYQLGDVMRRLAEARFDGKHTQAGA